ncbi:hypothetical protein SAVIM338S_02274 [Streptomyces avidinii]
MSNDLAALNIKRIDDAIDSGDVSESTVKALDGQIKSAKAAHASGDAAGSIAISTKVLDAFDRA